MALRWLDVDLAAGAIHVERAYDPKAGEYVEPKSRSGRRRVPIAGVLRDALDALRSTLSADLDAEALVFGEEGVPSTTTPFERARERHGRQRSSSRSACTRRGIRRRR